MFDAWPWPKLHVTAEALAESEDGLVWNKDREPCVVFGGRWDRVKCSEPSIMRSPDGRYRLLYEASDEAGVWRILSATAA